MKTIGRATGPGYFCLRCQRVFLSSLRCFFFRIFLRRFLTTEGNPWVLSFDLEAGRESLVGSEQIPQVDAADPEVFLEAN